MKHTALTIALIVLVFLAAVQLLAAAGRPVGRLLWGGSRRVLPPGMRIASIGAVGLYAGFAYILLTRAHHATDFTRVLAWVLFGYFTLSIAANLRSRSKTERAVMTPASAILAAATLTISLS